MIPLYIAFKIGHFKCEPSSAGHALVPTDALRLPGTYSKRPQKKPRKDNPARLFGDFRPARAGWKAGPTVKAS